MHNNSHKSTSIQFFNTQNFDLVLNYHSVVGSKYNYRGFADLDNLYKLNKMFSNNPWGDIIDRSGRTKYPFKVHIRNPWTNPNILGTKKIDLESACTMRVKEIINRYPAPYNLYWSGGIDSTLLIISFMKLVDTNELVVYLTKNSIKENDYFFDNIIKSNLKFIFSNGAPAKYGSNVTGECGDTIWAALDKDILTQEPIKNFIFKPWREWFQNKTDDIDFLNFAEKFMSAADRPINTLFDARWWFYLLCKSQSKATILQMDVFHDYNVEMIPFYESSDIETWAWYNVENMIKGQDWQTYKWPAKDIIYKFDKNKEYYKSKTKELSRDLESTKELKIDKPLFITDNLEKPILSTEPFFSKEAYRQEFHEKYKHLFEI